MQVKHIHTLRKRKKWKARGVRSSGLSFVGLESSLVSCLEVCWGRADVRGGRAGASECAGSDGQGSVLRELLSCSGSQGSSPGP